MRPNLGVLQEGSVKDSENGLESDAVKTGNVDCCSETDAINVSHNVNVDCCCDADNILSDNHIVYDEIRNGSTDSMPTDQNKKNMSYVHMVNKLSSNSDNKLVFKATDMSKEGKEYVVFDEELVKVGSAKWQLNVVGQCVRFRMSGAELSFPMKRVVCVKGISAIASSIGKPLIMDSMAANMCKQGFGKIDYARVLVEIDASKGFRDVIELMYKDKLNNCKGVKKVKVEYS
ncbi:hypothetical protein Tco_1094243 [Tanacetum coccineum]|uniref:Uncharacterized protein n=1 Tax=Tanacetum coccineum TaxID=301880 RepID=A0ABQ5IFH0_9ASTR